MDEIDLTVEPGDKVYLVQRAADKAGEFPMVVFECPACGYGHHVTVNGHRNACNATWTWNGDKKRPTLNPSIRVLGGREGKTTTCHCWVRDGKIQFCGDSPHELAGQTVDLPDIDLSPDT